MKVIIQRVSEASVRIHEAEKAAINNGMLVLLGIAEDDNDEDIEWLSGKISRLRIFNDENGIMNLSLLESNGDVLLISQFTLQASTKKGNRPSYIRAAKPEIAIQMYIKFITKLENELSKNIFTGEFGADMKVMLVNDGPVTIIMDSRNRE